MAKLAGAARGDVGARHASAPGAGSGRSSPTAPRRSSRGTTTRSRPRCGPAGSAAPPTASGPARRRRRRDSRGLRCARSPSGRPGRRRPAPWRRRRLRRRSGSARSRGRPRSCRRCRPAAVVADMPPDRKMTVGCALSPGEVRQQSAKPFERRPRPGRGVAGRFAARGNAGDARERLADFGGGRRLGANHRVGHRHERDPVARGHRFEELIDCLLGQALVAGTEGRVLDDELEDASCGRRRRP